LRPDNLCVAVSNLNPLSLGFVPRVEPVTRDHPVAPILWRPLEGAKESAAGGTVGEFHFAPRFNIC